MVLTICAAANATAQLAVQQPTERFLVLPFQAAVTDSAASIALADAVRERLGQIAKSKVQVIPKAKLCEALKQSGFPCDGLLTDEQARQLARFLQVHSYLTGDFQKSGAELSADVRMVDIASSGMAASYHATNGNPGTTAALAEAISQRAWVVIRASENVRECYTQRQGGQVARARQAAPPRRPRGGRARRRADGGVGCCPARERGGASPPRGGGGASPRARARPPCR